MIKLFFHEIYWSWFDYDKLTELFMIERLTHLEQTKILPSGDMEILLPLQHGTYQIEIVHAYGPQVFDPDDQIRQLVTGALPYVCNRRKILFGTHLNGFCPENCYDCPWSRSVMSAVYKNEPNHVFKQARPIDPAELRSALDQAKNIALDRGVISSGELLSAGNFLAGDPGFSPHLAELMAVMADQCVACKWSTTAPNTPYNVLEALQVGARHVAEHNPNHLISCQFSIHSTNEAARKSHVGYDLKSFAQIGAAAEKLHLITGRRVTLAFVIHAGSVIEPRELKNYFSPDHAIISLRPLLSAAHPPMPADRQVELYSEIRSLGWDVVYIPVGQAELDNMRTPHTGS